MLGKAREYSLPHSLRASPSKPAKVGSKEQKRRIETEVNEIRRDCSSLSPASLPHQKPSNNHKLNPRSTVTSTLKILPFLRINAPLNELFTLLRVN
ncbi:hypothetical protein AVEN_56806-1 [Araneus ventricosus]|uniref:Uncharacterized protein n=1 Tax=Araneus ventricosus TaxID=182803 RepID=A0A4Y2KAU7_ARAVE|nr:hypothetical protein AVEN_56806-1 [Araneus ventricosus]